jgi:hypothetical protein
MLQGRLFERYHDVKECPSYYQEVRQNTPRTQETHKDHFGALSKLAGSQWRAMSETEKAVRVTLMALWMSRNLVGGRQKYNDPANAERAAWLEKRKAEGHAKQ